MSTISLISGGPNGTRAKRSLRRAFRRALVARVSRLTGLERFTGMAALVRIENLCERPDMDGAMKHAIFTALTDPNAAARV